MERQYKSDYYVQNRLRALASRLRRFSEALTTDCQLFYQEHGIPFEPRWFALFQYLIARDGQGTFTGALTDLGMTQPSLSQIVKSMESAKMISVRTNPEDRRSKLLELTPKALALLPKLKPVWIDVLNGTLAIFHPYEKELADALEKIEDSLKKKTPFEFYQNATRDRLSKNSYVVLYDSKHNPIYRDLFENFFSDLRLKEEDEDLKLKNNPEKIIVEGGQIFFLFSRDQDDAIGMAMLKRFDSNVAELGKMYIRKPYRALGMGQKLLDEIVKWAGENKLKEIVLSSSANLNLAIRFYLKNGFEFSDRPLATQYERAEVWMRKKL